MSPSTASQPPTVDAAPSPVARRSRGATWRDPRLVVGVALVTLSVVTGAVLLSDADDTVGVWAARRDLDEGAAVAAGDLVRREVQFADSTDADRYLGADSGLPGGLTVSRAVGAGELVPRAALGGDSPASFVEVPVPVAPEAVPAGLRPGAVVDVWVTPEEAAGAAPRAVRVLEGVRVVAVPAAGSSLAPSAGRQVVVGVGADQESRLEEGLALLSTGSVLLTRRG